MNKENQQGTTVNNEKSNKQPNIPEILAPVGSVEAFYSAIKSGCDAVYLGGKNFGARAYANNFDQEQLKKLIDYAHIFGVQVYYTLNTIVKDIEMKQLEDELQFSDSVHMDAVIIQDLGVYHYIKTHYPSLVIHGSTQMNLHSLEDAREARRLGFDRVVLSRECCLDDIRLIKEQVPIEIEAFVHGALCYSYSGQCLMSSLYGERSGNRGKCAQPCRMPYEVDGEAGYYLSPKDQMTLEILPQLVKAGIDSFKIEGRMKSAAYVGFATKTYKKYRDLSVKLVAEGKEEDYFVEPKDIQKLNQLFNRGHFTEGYYTQHNDKEMISLTHGKNLGVKVGTLSYNNGYKMNFTTVIDKKDTLEVHTNINLKKQETWPSIQLDKGSSVGNYNTDQLFTTDQKRIDTHLFKRGVSYDLYRIRDTQLIDDLELEVHDQRQLPLSITVIAKIGQPLTFVTELPNKQLDYLDNSKDLTVSVVGNEVEASKNRPTVESDFKKQLGKTKDTSFIFDVINYDMDDLIFVPVGAINALRREILAKVEDELLSSYGLYQQTLMNSLNDIVVESSLSNTGQEVKSTKSTPDNTDKTYTLGKTAVLVRTMDQLNGLIQWMTTGTNKNDKRLNNPVQLHKGIYRIYIDITDIKASEINNSLYEIRKINGSNEPLQLFIALPHVIFNDYKKGLLNKLNQLDKESYDGFLIRTIGQIELIKPFKKPFATDYNLHCFSTNGLMQLVNMGASTITLSPELNEQGLAQISKSDSQHCETVVYGSLALMQSANCVYQTRNGRCDPNPTGHNLQIMDRKGISQQVLCHCSVCYNTIYNSTPLLLTDYKDRINGNYRFDFTTETKRDVTGLLRQYSENDLAFDGTRHTRGHFKRGVK